MKDIKIILIAVVIALVILAICIFIGGMELALYVASAVWIVSSFVHGVFFKEWIYSAFAMAMSVAMFYWTQHQYG